MASALTLVGLASLLAGGVVEGSLKYANVIRFRWVASLLVVPGLYTVCGKLLRRCSNRAALVFSPGKRDSRKEILGFESSGTYRYIGFHSGTRASVLNPLFESWLNCSNKYTKVVNSVGMRNRPNMGSKCVIGFAACAARDCDSRITVCEPLYIIIAAVCQAIAIGLFVVMVIKGDTAGIVLNAVNMIAFFLVSLVVTLDEFCVPRPQPSKNVKAGDMLVTDKANNKLWVVTGDEAVIQSVAQKEIETKRRCNEYVETAVYMFGTMVAIATILVVPIMSKTSQGLIVAQFGVGLFLSVIFSSRDGERMLKNIFDHHYDVRPRITRFTNRTTAVAAGVMHAKADTDQIHADILPVTNEFKIYREVLSEMSKKSSELQHVRDEILSIGTYDEVALAEKVANVVPIAKKLLSKDLDSWPNRLLADITEAFAETCYTDEGSDFMGIRANFSNHAV